MIRLLLAAGLILFLLWLLGLITSFTLDGGIHILLVTSIICFILWLLFSRRRG